MKIKQFIKNNICALTFGVIAMIMVSCSTNQARSSYASSMQAVQDAEIAEIADGSHATAINFSAE